MATGVIAAVLAVLPLAAVAQGNYGGQEGAIIGDGNVILGVAPYGFLEQSYRAVAALDLPEDDVYYDDVLLRGPAGVPGILFSEGWGAGIRGDDGVFIDECGATNDLFYDDDGPMNIDMERFRGEDGDDTADSTTVCGEFGLLRVRHQFRTAKRRPGCTGAYEIKVSVTNRACSALGEVIYRRTEDPDVLGTAFDDFFTIQGTDTTPFLDLASNSLTCDARPSTDCPTIDGEYDYEEPDGIDLPVVDSGPFDQGTVFQLNLGKLESGQRAIFRIYYGIFESQEDARACLDGAKIELYSLARDDDGITATGGYGGAGVTYLLGVRRTISVVDSGSSEECINWEGKPAPSIAAADEAAMTPAEKMEAKKKIIEKRGGGAE